MNSMKRKLSLGAVAALAVLALGACQAKSVTCTVQLSKQGAPVQFAPALNLAAANLIAATAATQAEGQGYTSLAVIVAGVSVADAVAAINAGYSSNQTFLRTTVTNARLVNTKGTAVLGMTRSGNPVASASFPYHVASGGQLRFDSASAVDQWILAYQGTADTLNVSVPDLTVDTGTSSQSVSFEAGADEPYEELASARVAWRSSQTPTCARCQLN